MVESHIKSVGCDSPGDMIKKQKFTDLNSHQHINDKQRVQSNAEGVFKVLRHKRVSRRTKLC